MKIYIESFWNDDNAVSTGTFNTRSTNSLKSD